MKIALLCGGPSLERGISLNSARSVLDHLESEEIEIVPIYFDHKKNAYQISTAQLYSNTPSDFDFKLQETAKPLPKKQLLQLLKSTDITFPVIHGPFGEDGEIQRFLERNKIPFVGSPSSACKNAFDKHLANEFLREKGFFTIPSAVLKIYHKDHKQILNIFFAQHKIKRAIVKPASGGSSVGVFSVNTVSETLEKAEYLFSKRIDTRVVVEPFCIGREFTTIILQNRFGMPVAILPTEIEMDYSKHQVFDYRKKYLPTNRVKYHCPPRFDNTTIERIQVQAEQLFQIFGMNDCARFDGWVLPDGNIWFSDFNPVSGMEQNSFLFQQSSRIGFSHEDLLRYIVKHACARQGVLFKDQNSKKKTQRKKKVKVIFGGKTAERQVSLMSGTNAWLKLRKSKKYFPQPYFLDIRNNVWKIPYALTLNHTAEEIFFNCEHAAADEERLRFLEEKVRLRLALEDGDITAPFFLPEKMSLEKFLENTKFLMIGLHGGIGEDGTLQKMLEQKNIKFNGPDSICSKICMDKWETAQKLQRLETHGIFTILKKSVQLSNFQKFSKEKFVAFWKELTIFLGTRNILVKPQSEGCSSGIVRLRNGEDVQKYTKLLIKNAPEIPPETFAGQQNPIELPLERTEKLLFEKFIETDTIRIKGNKLKWIKKTGWIELTVGVLEEKGKLRSLNPSMTVSEGAVLSVEEKFQGGTGINITPPPREIIAPKILERIKKSIEIVAKNLGIQGYSRIDIFANVENGDIIVIEANTLPALTPSTVLFHQGLAEKPPIFPREFLEKLIENKAY
ncbi:hypothetical protein HZA38_01015 [Candidatus Peregrinibacteria bacterium]|nr:hypothetical protein [Candidatus Peregrinibacteria bacterium]